MPKFNLGAFLIVASIVLAMLAGVFSNNWLFVWTVFLTFAGFYYIDKEVRL